MLKNQYIHKRNMISKQIINQKQSVLNGPHLKISKQDSQKELHLNQLKSKMYEVTQLLRKRRIKSQIQEGQTLINTNKKIQSQSLGKDQYHIMSTTGFKKIKKQKNMNVIQKAKKVINKTHLTIQNYSPKKQIFKNPFLNKSQRLCSTQQDQQTRTYIQPDKIIEKNNLERFLTNFKELKGKIQKKNIEKGNHTKSKEQLHQIIDKNINKERPLTSLPRDISSHPRVSHGFMYGKELGKGKFGHVFLAQHLQTGFIVAIKKVNKEILKENKTLFRFIQQIKLHKGLDHPNIVKFYGVFQEQDSICLVLEYLNGGTLFDHLNQVFTVSIEKAVGFLRQVINALEYLHKKKIIHRDVKPQNIVISSTGLAKLCDFGWSTLGQTLRTTFCGTLDYASPEIVQHKQYDESVDVWCIGVLAYQLLIGKAPFQSQDRDAVMRGIINVNQAKLPLISKLHPRAIQFIQAILQKEPNNRPKIFELLSFPLFTQFSQSKASRKQSLKIK